MCINIHVHLDALSILIDYRHGFWKRPFGETQLILTIQDVTNKINTTGWRQPASVFESIWLQNYTIAKRLTIPKHSLRETFSMTKEGQRNFVTRPGTADPRIWKCYLGPFNRKQQSETGDCAVYSRSHGQVLGLKIIYIKLPRYSHNHEA